MNSWIGKYTLNWKQISVLGQNKIVNSSYIYLFIVPVIAKLFSSINSPVDLILGGYEFQFVLTLPFNWKLFFFAALLFTIGSLVYNLRAPNIIKENDSYSNFTTNKKNFGHLIEYKNELGITHSLMNKIGFIENLFEGEKRIGYLQKIEIRELEEKYVEKAMVYTFVENSLESYYESGSKNESKVFWRIYKYALACRKTELVLTNIAFLSGLILIAIIIIQGTMNVIGAI
ncbi:hypothetical protein [Flagellimonas eckloniae]|uniref:Uncharacterized protein n=1 Tax=Flagellimonas eckloniae TaxID=346185 RepID=A0A0Q0WUX5_9FLAO|nr:hypothetical protein [Allomuricauda eckloniae]KQC29256.1 hypothetical protein AAY42_04565 [Allomuricauda eckloniae]